MKTTSLKARVFWDDKVFELPFFEGENVLDILRREPSLPLSFPCGGKRTCGKCHIEVQDGSFPEPDERERRMLEKHPTGTRMACFLSAFSDFSVRLQSRESGARIRHSGLGLDRDIEEPLYRQMDITLPPMDSNSEHKQLRELLPDGTTVPLSHLVRLTALTGEKETPLKVGIYNRRLINLDHHASARALGAAMDIGTTTMVLYLIDLDTGEIVDTASLMNPQRQFGHDVISRLEYARTSPGHLEKISRTVKSAINELLGDVISKNEASVDDILGFVLVGNTAMIHILAELPPAKLCESPFTPVSLDALHLTAEDLSLDLAGNCPVYILPGLSPYVGSDITAGLIATEAGKDEENIILVDIGTNGEIVLSVNGSLSCCSTAAGPAFEGANIEAGMGGVKGAVSRLAYRDGEFSLNVIGGGEPLGLCGSGIIDGMAFMLDNGLIDETGRIPDRDEVAEEHLNLYDRCVKGREDGLIVTMGHDAVFLTQKDVREIQLGKAAISGGIKTILKDNGLDSGDVDKVYLAGGFGSYIDLEHAVRIGLIPVELHDKVIPAGNTAGMGSIVCLLDSKAREQAEEYSRKIRELELSTHPVFQEEYVMGMYF